MGQQFAGAITLLELCTAGNDHLSLRRAKHHCYDISLVEGKVKVYVLQGLSLVTEKEASPYSGCFLIEPCSFVFVVLVCLFLSGVSFKD